MTYHPCTHIHVVPSDHDHILNDVELRVLSRLIDAHSHVKVKEIRRKQGGHITREQVEDLLREGEYEQTTTADKLKKKLLIGTQPIYNITHILV